MKVTMKYDQGVRREEVVILEVPEKELEKMVEIDYHQRLRQVTGDEVVLKRAPQEILNEMNRQERNSWQTHNRRLVSLQKESFEGSEMNTMDIIADNSQEEERQRQELYEDMCQKIRQLLKPEHADMVIAICLDKMAVKEYAREINDKPNNVTQRFKRIKTVLKKVL